MAAVTDAAVVVPARDEELTLPACLRSLRVAVDALTARRHDVTARVIVVLDDCTDGSRAIVAATPAVEIVESTARTAGGARAVGAAHALGGCRHPATTWLANTDADSTVPPDWLVTMVALADAGADVILGTVEPDVALSESVRARWLARHDLGENHRHVHGANFGLRASTYRDLGGWTAVATGEDVALAARADGRGVPVRRTASIPVVTSSRRVGRAPDGFATYLAALTA